MTIKSIPSSSPITVRSWLRTASHLLKEAGIASHQLDAELILAETLMKDRPWLIAHSEFFLTDAHLHTAGSLLARRSDHEPLAYLRQWKEFYGRRFIVNRSVLVPRPETEVIIEIMRELHPIPPQRLIDIGTGSGAVGITASLEFPGTEVLLTDVSRAALQVAAQNADALGAPVQIQRRNLLASTISFTNEKPYDFIIANLPYVDHGWERSAETEYEPALALFAPDNRLSLIKKLISQLPSKLLDTGFVLLEADPRQHNDIIEYAHAHRLRHMRTQGFIVVLSK